jgi:ketosteroid isomerase-like protein
MTALTQIPETGDLLNNFFQGIGQRDGDAVAGCFAASTYFYISESPLLPWSGSRFNRDGVKQAIQLLSEAHVPGEDKFETDHVFIDGNEAAVFGTVSRQVIITGKRFSALFSMRFTFENGLITKLLMLEESRKIEEAFKS